MWHSFRNWVFSFCFKTGPALLWSVEWRDLLMILWPFLIASLPDQQGFSHCHTQLLWWFEVTCLLHVTRENHKHFVFRKSFVLVTALQCSIVEMYCLWWTSLIISWAKSFTSSKLFSIWQWTEHATFLFNWEFKQQLVYWKCCIWFVTHTVTVDVSQIITHFLKLYPEVWLFILKHIMAVFRETNWNCDIDYHFNYLRPRSRDYQVFWYFCILNYMQLVLVWSDREH